MLPRNTWALEFPHQNPSVFHGTLLGPEALRPSDAFQEQDLQLPAQRSYARRRLSRKAQKFPNGAMAKGLEKKGERDGVFLGDVESLVGGIPTIWISWDDDIPNMMGKS